MLKKNPRLARMLENLGAREQRCLLCFAPLTRGMSFHQVFMEDDVVCSTCRKSLKRVDRWIRVGGIQVYAYYAFDDAMSTLFHRYKEAHDQMIGSLFLHPIRKFDRRYKNKSIVCIPSSEEKIKERGFMTLGKILEGSKLPQIEVLRKAGNEKQSLRTAHQRVQVKEEIILQSPLLAEDKDLILFDDVLTTGSTMLACHEILSPIARSLTCICVAIHPIFLEKHVKKAEFDLKKQFKRFQR
jgi:competence protein ComFC